MQKALSAFVALMAIVALILLFRLQLDRPSGYSADIQQQAKEQSNQEALPVLSAINQAINQAKEMAVLEEKLEPTLKKFGINCGIFVTISIEQCAKFVERVLSDSRLSSAVQKAKENQVFIVPSTFFEINANLVFIDPDSITQKIIKFIFGASSA